MGRLVEGVWTDQWYDTAANKGAFVRAQAQFRESIEPGARFEPEAGRYHLVVADACPWCHRVVLARALFGLEDVISMTRVGPLMLDQGWEFEQPDAEFGATKAYEYYLRADPSYTGRVTVPIVWDRREQTIVNNESSEIIRFLDEGFRSMHTREQPHWYPEEHRAAIDAVNAWIYTDINNGVYRCGFATTQTAYDDAVNTLFAALDRAEKLLEGRQWLVGDSPTEADWRLFVTLVRFDAVYHGHFKCNVRRIVDYPALQAHTERLWAMSGVKASTDMRSIRLHYYASHESINPSRVVAAGPADSPFQ